MNAVTVMLHLDPLYRVLNPSGQTSLQEEVEGQVSSQLTATGPSMYLCHYVPRDVDFGEEPIGRRTTHFKAKAVPLWDLGVQDVVPLTVATAKKFLWSKNNRVYALLAEWENVRPQVNPGIDPDRLIRGYLRKLDGNTVVFSNLATANRVVKHPRFKGGPSPYHSWREYQIPGQRAFVGAHAKDWVWVGSLPDWNGYPFTMPSAVTEWNDGPAQVSLETHPEHYLCSVSQTYKFQTYPKLGILIRGLGTLPTPTDPT